MNASSLLAKIAAAMHKVRLEAVMVGNAAAALHGSPVTTVDFDFVFRETAVNLKKLRALADHFKGEIVRPYYPASALYRLTNPRIGLQLDFMPRIEGIRSFAGLRSRATAVRFGSHNILLADLRDIIKSKRAAGRPQDKAVLRLLEITLEEKEK
ncbi:MAG: hypothetical protein J5J00_10870 [Deltaproteobacteria bacterium]|nr:hypothetical protein [Deltaproteobacteria bacterium]